MRLICNLAVVVSLIVALGGSAWAEETTVTTDEPTTATTTTRQKTQSVRQENKAKLDQAKTALEELKIAKKADNQVRTLEKVKNYGNKAIGVRLEVLNNHSTRSQNWQCSEADKTAIANSVATLKTVLTTKQTELAAATEAEAARTIVKTAIEQTRIFMFWAPSTRGLCLASRLIALIDGRLTTTVSKLEVAKLNVTEIKAKMTEAKTKLTAAHDLYLVVVQASGGNDEANRTKLSQAKAAIQEAKKLLGEIKSAIGNLKGDYQKTLTPTSNSDASGETKTPAAVPGD